MYKRKLASLVSELLSEFRIVYLAGPRQVGKTTLTKLIAENLHMTYLSLDEQSILQSAQTDPAGFIAEYRDQKIVLDEFQYVSELIPAIKKSSDSLIAGERGKFLLTGSADIFKSAQVQEALPGHMAKLELYPLSLSEKLSLDTNIVDYLCIGDFKQQQLPVLSREKLAKAIIDGGYPEVQDKTVRAKQYWYTSYLEGRLYKDFETLYAARGDYHSKLQSLIPYLAGIAANLLKYANVSSDLGLDDKMVKSYIEILELMFIIKRVPAYIKNKAKRMAITMPKLQMIDTGLTCYLLGIKEETQLVSDARFGSLLENFIYMELLKHVEYSEHEVELFHFRDKYQHEVDIVLEDSSGSVIGVEIKASTTVKSQDFKGLLQLADFCGSRFRYGVLLYTGEEVLPFSQNNIKLYALPISILFS